MTPQAQQVDRRWLKRWGRRDEPARVRLFCFHHAGGVAGMFRPWPDLFPPAVEPIAVQLPGRADRFKEAPFTRMEPLVDELIEVLTPLLDQPFACFGASMGARVSWALAHALRERALPGPERIYVSANRAPVVDIDTWPWQNRADGLTGYMREMGGTSAEVLEDDNLLALLLPALEADLTVLSTHLFRPAVPLDVPIRAFAGVDDIDADPDRMAGWGVETRARFDLDPLPCGHFFDAAGERRVIETIARELTAETSD